MNKCSSIFGQILQIFNRYDFEKVVRETKSEKGTKGFSSWDQFVAMLFCQLGQAHSLREICGGLATCLGKMKHLGVNGAPHRSTLAYANEHRPWELYQNVLLPLSKVSTPYQRQEKVPIQNKLLSLDASTVELCSTLFDWARFRQTKGAVKLHLLLDHEGYLPVFALITEGVVHEVNIARDLIFPKGSILAVDRGYTDYSLFAQWTQSGVYFVTRQKDNATYRVVEEKTVPTNRHILKDEIITFTGYYAEMSSSLRRIEVDDVENNG